MTCPVCIKMCAITEQQLQVRLDNMANAQGVAVNPCSKCGSIDWATTREMIKPEPVRRWYDAPAWFARWANTWSLQTVRILHIVAGIWCLVFAAIEQDKWQVFASAFIAGINLIGAFYATLHIRVRKREGEMMKVMEDVMAMNRALLHGKVHEITRVMIGDDDDSPPTAPKMH